jgi:two-component system LytT family response regulator
MTYRVLIVDDEPLARRGVRAHLRAVPDVDVVGDCASGHEALRAIGTVAPDLVFLDIEMPDMTGFDVIDQLGPGMPAVIFLTAYARHAIRAFDVAAVDYLLKPLNPERLSRALERARPVITARRTRGSPHTAAAAEPFERFWVRVKGEVILVPVTAVRWISSEGDYVRLHTADRSHLIPGSLSSLEVQLPAAFCRIHRSTIVDVTRVATVKPMGVDHMVRLRSGAELRVSRTFYRRLIARLNGGSRGTCVSPA